MTRTAGNLILMTLICVVIFIAVMAVRPASAAELSRKMLGSWCGQWVINFLILMLTTSRCTGGALKTLRVAVTVGAFAFANGVMTIIGLAPKVLAS